MDAALFFRAPGKAQSVAIDRIARWDEFTTSSFDAALAMDEALACEQRRRPRRRKVIRALEAAIRIVATRAPSNLD